MIPTAHITHIADELGISPRQVEATSALLTDGATVPFLARYRKEATGSLDEVAITAIRDRMAQLAELDKRREAILQSLTERNLLTDELAKNINSAATMTELEDYYLPYRPKRRTRATVAKEKGLEPLAQFLLIQQRNASADPTAAASRFVSAEHDVANTDDALAGARDIIAEGISEDQAVRAQLREHFVRHATLSSALVKGKDETEAAKFKDYFDWNEPATSAPSHRILAIFRGENEGILKVHLLPPEETANVLVQRAFVQGTTAVAEQVSLAAEDSYKRLLAPSLEKEFRNALKQRADEQAIHVFAENLRELLLASPLGQRRVLALDPGFRTGCKLVCLDAQGNLLHYTAIFPHTGDRQRSEAVRTVRELCTRFAVEAIAIGNGTAGRETEAFIRGLQLPSQIAVVMVNESGASIYSASEVAREEFPDYDVTVRGAVSIGRRLQDPLGELVKIDPKSIGVGQYQHDVDQTALKHSLDDVVVSCVNRVGVDANTASAQLLTYVSGIGPVLAKNIVSYRQDNGPFTSRTQFKKVKGLGPKAFEQAAGFLRIRNGKQPLDASAVHPESYPVIDRICADLGCTVTDLLKSEDLRKRIVPSRYVSEKIGLPTLHDIVSELAKPGRDPREQFEAFSFAEGINALEDLHEGMKLPGIVTNVTAFGAFVDIGVHQDGLVHISHLADSFVKNPHDIVKVAQRVQVTVIGVDLSRKRVALSMKADPFASSPRR
ncbi:MAG TPA: Tex family protein [Armatimonadota bacterium]|nr:Tex family protein [Armatimonadota bacterium]